MIKYFDINESGHSVKCKIYCNNMRDITKVILYGHGFGGHKDNKAAERFAETLLSKYKKSAVICFDLPCHGDDVKKKLVLDDCSTYIDILVNYVKEHLHVTAIGVYATSFGGYVFLKYLHEKGNPFSKIALRCPAVNMYEVISKNRSEEEWNQLQKGNSIAIGFDHKINVTSSFLEDLKVHDITEWDYTDFYEDILIMHGSKDEVVPYEPVFEFADNNLIDFILVENADHRFRDHAIMGTAIKQIIEFLM